MLALRLARARVRYQVLAFQPGWPVRGLTGLRLMAE